MHKEQSEIIQSANGVFGYTQTPFADFGVSTASAVRFAQPPKFEYFIFQKIRQQLRNHLFYAITSLITFPATSVSLKGRP